MIITISLDCEYDEKVVEKLKSEKNKQGYIKKLIMKDIGITKENVKKRNHGKKAIDLTGKRFGKWTVIERNYEATRPGLTMWVCRCDCGTERNVAASSLLNGTSKQCNECRLQKRKEVDPRKRVNGKLTHTYMTWDAIRHRCYYPSQASYKNYGARGITMCDEWKNDYFAFYDYVSKLDRFGEEGMTIDRIDNDRGYEPGNVRWATRAEQNRHKRDKE